MLDESRAATRVKNQKAREPRWASAIPGETDPNPVEQFYRAMKISKHFAPGGQNQTIRQICQTDRSSIHDAEEHEVLMEDVRDL